VSATEAAPKQRPDRNTRNLQLDEDLRCCTCPRETLTGQEAWNRS